MKLLFVLTSHGEMGDTDRVTGFFLPEIAHPYEIFHAIGSPDTRWPPSARRAGSR